MGSTPTPATKQFNMRYKPLPPLEELREYLDYNPDTGIFTWKKIRPRQNPMLGQVAGSIHNEGYISIEFKGSAYLAHRLAYYMYYGIDPLEKLVDHKDEPKTNNKINNLRLATVSQNGMNRVNLASNNTSGCTGVSWNAKEKKWCVQINYNGLYKYLGLFTNKEEAIKVRKEAEIKYFGEFRRQDQ